MAEAKVPANPRYERQADIVPMQKLDGYDVCVIGTGAVGKQLVCYLAAMGVPRLTVVDFDKVEEVNIPTQGWYEDQLNMAKVDALQELVTRTNKLCKLTCINDRFASKHLPNKCVVFSCVDDMDVRKQIWLAAQHAAVFIDGRMLGENMQVLAAERGKKSWAYYPTTLFTQAEREPGRCTAAGTIYTAAALASLEAHQFTRWLRNGPLDGHLGFELRTSSMYPISQEQWFERPVASETPATATAEQPEAQPAATT